MDRSLPYDKTDKWSIFDYSKRLLNRTLLEAVGKDALEASSLKGQGKGGLEHMLESLFFMYPINSDSGPDFKEAGVELKGTGLKQLKSTDEYAIKERLVCDMVDYCDVVTKNFEESSFFMKCRIMLLIFYLYRKDVPKHDLKFIYTALWQIPEKDLIIIRNDFNKIVEKIRNGNAHNLSDGDTDYLAVCRKGQKGDKLRKQPFSEILAPARAFSLKPAYMRTVLEFIKNSGTNAVSNINRMDIQDSQLVSKDQLKQSGFETILLNRFKPFIGLCVDDIMSRFSMASVKSKDINYRIASLIVSDGKCTGSGSNKIELTEEFKKSGLTLKTVSLYSNGRVKESMSFRNIDYEEIYENDDWFNSEAYELFSSRFLFVVFRHPSINSGAFGCHSGELILEDAFFWTMPQADLETARLYWEDIRANVLADNIHLSSFWSLNNHRTFHVRPKGTAESYKKAAINPNGGFADKYCYWINSEYIKKIIQRRKIDNDN